MSASIQYLREILVLLGSERKRIPTLLLLFVCAALLDFLSLGLIVPYVTIVIDPERANEGSAYRYVTDLIAPNLNYEQLLYTVSFALVTVFLVRSVLTLWVQYLIVEFGQQQQLRLRSHLLQSFQSISYEMFQKRNSSEYVFAIQQLAGQFQVTVQSLLKATSDAIVVAAIMVVLALNNPMVLSVLILLLATIVFSYDRLLRRRIRNWGQSANRAGQRMIRGVNESLAGLKEIRMLGKEQHFHQQVMASARDLASLRKKNEIAHLAPRYALETALVAFVVFVVVVSFQLQESPTELLGTLGLFGVAAMRLTPIASAFAQTLSRLRYNRDAVSRLHSDVKHFDAVEKIPAPVGNGPVFASLEVDNITYAYPDTDRAVLDSLSFTVAAGDSIGFVGPSGSGKTTLINVLLGLLVPQSGEIRLNGQDLRGLIRAWQSQIAYLPQEAFIIDDSLKRNVAMGEDDDSIDTDHVIKALHQARLEALIEELPSGLDTIVGEKGMRLSGGQRQRVALARAFYFSRSVLVLDESTSALDTETERQIVAEIAALKGKMTLFVIAHRISTVQHCDRIYRIENGRIDDVTTKIHAAESAAD